MIKNGIRSSDGRHFMDNWPAAYRSIIEEDPLFFSNLLRKNPRLIFWVGKDCRELLFSQFQGEISQGLRENWEVVFSMGKGWFAENYERVPELQAHFEKRPGLWFYVFRYDQKKVNPRTGEVGADLRNAWKVMDHWGIRHPEVQKVGNEYKVVDNG